MSNFALPDLRGNVMVGQGHGLGLSDYLIGQRDGVNNVTLNEQEIPEHNHIVEANTQVATLTDPTKGLFAVPAVNPRSGNLYSGHGGALLAPNAVTNTGSSEPHSNEQPFLVLNVVIALVGIFPSRN